MAHLSKRGSNLALGCRSEVDDINLGLQHFYDSFNVAHARLVSSGVSARFPLMRRVGSEAAWA